MRVRDWAEGEAEHDAVKTKGSPINVGSSGPRMAPLSQLKQGDQAFVSTH